MKRLALTMLTCGLLASAPAYGQATKPENTIRIYSCTKPGDSSTCTTTVTPAAQASHRGGPNGSSALCNDGSYSKALHLDPDTCAGHQGVKTWYGH
jgi:hypothetical protein